MLGKGQLFNHWRSILSCITLTLGLTIMTACTPYLEKPHTVRGVTANTPEELVQSIAITNEEALAYYQSTEWPLNAAPNQSPQPPRLGISLSGGGMRSAIFSLGVLTGLHEAGLGLFPEKTDLLSAVSGGSYIASWFYGQQVLNGATPADLLDPEGVPQSNLRNQASLIKIYGNPEGIAAIAGNIALGIPLNLLANGVFGFRANTTIPAYYYEHRIQTVFLKDEKQNKPGSVSWSQIDSLLQESAKRGKDAVHLPNFILNTAVDLGVGTHAAEQSGFNTIYEFTPQRFGSDGMGYYCLRNASEENCPKRQQLAPVERIVEASGAAFDSSFLDTVAPGIIERKVVSALNFDLGFWFENPSDKKSGCWQKYVPLLHLLNGKWYRKDAAGCRILLTDGGHAENLGVYSLVRRAPSAIIVVDAESDPGKQFGSYKRLRQMLLNDLNVVLSIPAIDEERWSEGPVFLGSAGAIPVQQGSMPMSISVIYIKLPAAAEVRSECICKKLPVPLCKYQETHQKFPQDSTFGDQSFDPDQFSAYRDLGLAVIRNNRSEISTGLLQVFPELAKPDAH